MTGRIPATVVTGFLGAGKTSLLRHVIAGAAGRRLALIVNEFGTEGVDGGILQACAVPGCPADAIVELANGCICCTVADDFLPAIEKLLNRPEPPDGLLIETSGLALPKPLIKAFAWPEARARLTVDGVVALVDAQALAEGRFAGDAAGSHLTPLAEVFADQVAAADLVVLNKADLVSPQALARIEPLVRAHMRPAARLLHATHGQLPLSVLLGLGAAAEDDLATRPSLHELEGEGHDHDEFESFVVELPPIEDPATLLAAAETAARAHPILRLKGFVDVPGRALRHVVQGTAARLTGYYDRPWNAGEARASRLVVIGLAGLDRARIAAGLGGTLGAAASGAVTEAGEARG
jgi:cobalamin biosynthesis protein CobW